MQRATTLIPKTSILNNSFRRNVLPSACIRSAHTVSDMQFMNARALKKVVPSEDEIRRVVVGLSFSPTQKGLSPATSYQEVVNFFVKSGRNEADVVEKVNSILMTKTKLIKTKLGSTVVDWIY